MENIEAVQPQVQQPQQNSFVTALGKVLGTTEGSATVKPEAVVEPNKAAPVTQPKEVVEPQAATPAAPVESPNEPVQPQQQPKPFDWRDAIKKEKIEDVLAALYDDDQDFIKLGTVRKTTGNLDPYFNAYKNDYKSMSPEQLIKLRIDSDASLTPEEKADLYQDEMSSYKLDPDQFTEQEIRVSKARMKQATNAYREQLLKEQESWAVKALDPIEKAKAQAEQAKLQQTESLKQFERTLLADPLVVDALSKKSIKIGSGKDAIQLPVANAQAAIDILTEKKSLNEFMVNEDGTPNIEAAFLTALFASDRKGFIKSLTDLLKEKGKEEIINPMENLQPFGRNNPPNTEKLTDAQYAIRQKRA